MVTVHPTMHEDIPKKVLTDFECKVTLRTDADWVAVPERFVLAAATRGFKVTVDPTALKAGYHTAHIVGIDSEFPDRGPLFRVPVTVTQPLPMAREVAFQPSLVRGTPTRFFVTPPPGSTWMDIKVSLAKSASVKAKNIIVLHTVQMGPHRTFSKTETKTYLRFGELGEYDVVSRKVDGQASIELCFALYWSELEETGVSVDVTFHGIMPSNNNVTVVPGSGFTRIDLSANLSEVEVSPSATLKTWGTPLRPTKAEVYPLSSRHDLLEGETLHELKLGYTFTADEATSITPRCRLINDRVYETEVIGGPYIFVLDSRKKVLGYSDIYPAGIKVPEGEIALVAYLRHPSAKVLERFTDLVVTVERALPKSIKLKVYPSPGNAVLGKEEVTKKVMARGSTLALFFAEPEHSALPKALKPTDVLSGVVQYSTKSGRKLGEGSRPGGYSLTYFAPPTPTKPPVAAVAAPADKRAEVEKLADAIKKLRVSTLKGLIGKDGFDAVHAEVAAAYPDDLDVATAKLHHADAGKGDEARAAVVVQADAVLGLIDLDKLAAALGRLADADDTEGVKAREKETAKKDTLLDALNRKALALADLGKGDEAEAVARDMRQWGKVDANDKFQKLSLAMHAAKGYWGKIAVITSKQLAKADVATRSAMIVRQQEALSKLGWAHIAAYERKWELIRSPPSGLPAY